MAIYAKLGDSLQDLDGYARSGWRLMPNIRPEGFYICQDIDGVSGEWVEGMTPEEAKLYGILFAGVMCSATAEDQHGLKDIEDYVLAGNDVNFHFENGNTLVLTSANWASFYAVWVPFRQSFFPLP